MKRIIDGLIDKTTWYFGAIVIFAIIDVIFALFAPETIQEGYRTLLYVVCLCFLFKRKI